MRTNSAEARLCQTTISQEIVVESVCLASREGAGNGPLFSHHIAEVNSSSWALNVPWPMRSCHCDRSIDSKLALVHPAPPSAGLSLQGLLHGQLILAIPKDHQHHHIDNRILQSRKEEKQEHVVHNAGQSKCGPGRSPPHPGALLRPIDPLDPVTAINESSEQRVLLETTSTTTLRID